MEIQFCDVCDNLLYLKKKDKDSGIITMMCHQGHEKVFNIEDQEKKIDQDTPVRDVEYNFPNKEASRKIVKKMLEEIKARGMVKPFSEQKVLILTHVEGLDLRQSLLPLGYKKENILIVEREYAVYKEIHGDPFFEGCDIKHMDLEDFTDKTKFDLIYLDFKSNFSNPVKDILRRLLINNSIDGTTFYINLQMARENAPAMSVLYELGNDLMKKCEETIQSRTETFSQFVSALEPALYEAERRGTVLDIKINGKRFRFKEENVPVNREMVTTALNGVKEEFEKGIVMETQSKKILENQDNFHVLRQKALKLYTQTILNAFLLRTENFMDTIGNDDVSINLAIDTFKIEDIPPRRQRLIPVMRYLGKTLSPLYFTQFIYKNNSSTPFMNTFFVLKSQESILKSLGFSSFFDAIGEAFIVFWMKGRDMIRHNAIMKSLVNYKIYEEYLVGNLETKNDIEMFEQDYENKMRDIVNMMKQVYLDLQHLNLLKIDDDGNVVFQFLDSSLSTVKHSSRYTKLVNAGKSGKLRSRKFDYSPSVLVFYLIFKFLNVVEQTIEKNVLVETCETIDIDTDGDVEQTVDLMFPSIFKEEKIVEASRELSAYMMRMIDNLEGFGTDFSDEKKFAEDRGARLREFLLEKKVIINSIKKLFNTSKKTTGGNVKMEEKTTKTLTNKQLKDLIRKFVMENYETISEDIAEMVNEHVIANYGFNPGVTDCTIRAHKYWHRVNVIEKEANPSIA